MLDSGISISVKTFFFFFQTLTCIDQLAPAYFLRMVLIFFIHFERTFFQKRIMLLSLVPCYVLLFLRSFSVHFYRISLFLHQHFLSFHQVNLLCLLLLIFFLSFLFIHCFPSLGIFQVTLFISGRY